jgi:hypothetical protein
VKRTSAGKFSTLCARIVKEISRASDRARCARNFMMIARSRKAALEAIVRDRDFFRRGANFSKVRRTRSNFFFAIEKNFPAQEIFKDSR